MADFGIQGEVVLDSSKAESSVDRLGNAAGKMAINMRQAGENAGRAVDKIGDIAASNTEKFTRSEAAMVASIKKLALEAARAQPVIDKLGDIEFNIAAKGLDASKFKPMLDVVQQVSREAQAAAAAAAPALNKIGVSAAQTQAALRQLPAQFTDIVVSLQGGQAPLTVLLQQGGQIKDSFGGAGNAVKAMGGYIAGLVSPTTVAAAAVAAFGAGMYIVESEARKLSDVGIAFKAVGREAVLSAEDIKTLRREVSLLPQMSKDSAGAVITEFARTRDIGIGMLKGLSLGINDFAVALGQDAPAAAKTLAKAFADPAKGAKDLDEILGFLTSNQLLTIKSMVEMNDKAGAQKVMLEALAAATKGLAKEGTDLEKATDGFSKKWSEAMGNIGDSAALKRANEVLAGIITTAGDAALALSKMKLPDWMMLLPGGAGLGLKVTTEALGALYPSKDAAAPAAPAQGSQPVNWNGGKGRPTLTSRDLLQDVPTFAGITAPGPLRIEYTPKTLSTQLGAPSPAPAAPAQTSKELDAQVKFIMEANKGYKSQKAQVEDIRKEIKLTTTTLDAVRKEEAAAGLKTSPRQEELQGILEGQKEKLESALKKGGGMADAANAAVQAFKNADKEILRSRKAFLDEMDALMKSGNVGELDAIERTMEKEDELYAQRKANFDAELANAKAKKNSQAEQTRIDGAMKAAAEEHEQNMARLRRESAAATAKAVDDLERMVQTEQRAARSSSAKVKAARDENAEIGLTGEALGKVRQARVDDAAALVGWAADAALALDPTGRLSAAIRQQAQDLRDAAKERGYGDSARMVAEYTKSVNEASAAIEFETSVMGLSSRERDVAIAKYKIQIDLANRLNKILADNPTDPAAVVNLSNAARNTAAKDAENAEKRLQLDEVKQTVQQYDSIFRQGFADMLNNGKDGWKSFTKSLATTFKTTVADQIYKQFAQPLVINMVGALMGVGGGGGGAMAALGGGGGSNPLGALFQLGSAGYQAYTGQGMIGAAWNGLTSFFGGGGASGLAGPIASKAALDGTLSFGGNSVLGNSLGAGAAGGSWMAGGVAGMIAMAAINVLGGMRSESKIGSGLRGTLGNGSELEPWEEWREGGTLVSGPEFTNHNPLATLKDYRRRLKELQDSGNGASQTAEVYGRIISEMEKNTKGLEEATRAQSNSINKAYDGVRSNVVKMADNLGLAGSKVKDFAQVLDMQDLNFQGLKPEEVEAKITALMGKAGAEITKQVLGSWETVTETITRVVQENVGSSQGEDSMFVYREESETTTKKVYRPSEYAKPGETALDTLTRLSTAFTTLNEAADALGFGAQKGTLALADFADGFIELAGGLERFNATMGAFIKNYLSPEKQREYLARSGARDFEALGIKGITAEVILNATPDQVFAAVNSLAEDPKLYFDAMDIANKIFPVYATSVTSAAEKTEELADVVDELAQAFENAIKSLKQERGNLQVQLARAGGDEAGARQLEKAQFFAEIEQHGVLDALRRRELETLYDGNVVLRDAIDARNELNGLQQEYYSLTDTAAQALKRQRDALHESNRALFDNIQALKLQKTIAQELPGVLDKYRTPGQRRMAQYDDVAKGLTDAGIIVSGSQVANASKEQFAAAVLSVYNLGTTTDDMRLSLVRAAGAMADIKDAEIDEAFANLQQVVQRELTAAQTVRDEIKAVFELLESSVDDLYGEVESTSKAAAAQGVDYITKALAAAQTTGILPELKPLTNAIRDARAGMDGTQYTSQFERDRDRLVLAGKLSDLEDISGDQLTEAERQVKYLERLVDDAQKQINELKGINSGVGTVADALQDLADALAGRTNAVPNKPVNMLTGRGQAEFNTVTGRGITETGVAFDSAVIAAEAQKALNANPGAGTVNAILDMLDKSGFSLATANEIFKMPPGTLEAEAKALGRPIFHDGTPYVPETGYALLQRGEMVIPTAFNPMVHGRGLGDTSRLEAQLARLTAEVQRLQSLQEAGNTHAEAAVELWDNVTEGGNGIRAEIMNKVELAA